MKIQPFKALRGKPELIEKISCLPYDVVNFEDIKDESKNPYSFFHVTRAEIDMPDIKSVYDQRVYERGAKNLSEMIEKGLFIRDDEPSFYIYSQDFQGRTQTGLVALFSVDDYERDVIKKHELTRADKEQDRVEHLLACEGHTEPVFLTFKAPEDFKPLLKKVQSEAAIYDFVSEDGVGHKLWRDSSLINQFQSVFEKVSGAYIADGHHRAAAAAQVSRKKGVGYFLAVIFPHEDLKILPYHRVVKNHLGLGMTGILEKLVTSFGIEDIRGSYEPRAKHEFGFYFHGSWKRLILRRDKWHEEDPVKSLDVYAIQEYFLKPIFGINDPRTDKNIDFIGGIKGVRSIESFCEQNPEWLGISMPATAIDEVMRVSDAGLIMPPKSTWFEPKLRSGLFLNLFE